MNKQTSLPGILLILASISFWISWFLMPDPGTTDTRHILQIVKQSRQSVLASVVIQIISSLLYIIAALYILHIRTQKNRLLKGTILIGIGALGFCADAFFHLLAYYMTSDSVNIQQDVVQVMEFMQTKALVFLVPLLLPLFIGTPVLIKGLNRESLISKKAGKIFILFVVIGLLGALVSNILKISIPGFSMILLGLFATSQLQAGFELFLFDSRIDSTGIQNESI